MLIGQQTMTHPAVIRSLCAMTSHHVDRQCIAHSGLPNDDESFY